ncbi:MAG: small basic family protein [Clostridia bacterium]|nr:small basic family protein [Clostridia bacterium]
MTFTLGLICVILGCVVGSFMPTISYVYSKYLAIAIMAALDSIIGALSSTTQNKFDMSVFISGFFVNAVIAIMFTMIGENLNVDIYLAAIFVFVYRIFNNLAVIRRHFIGKVVERKK